MKIGIGALAAALIATPVAAAEPRDILVNMSQEAVECASFFLLASVVAERFDDSSQAERFGLLSGEALQYAHTLAIRAGQMPEAVEATWHMVVRNHRQRIGDDLANFAILSEAYMPLCPEVMQSPGLRVEHWQRELRQGE